jgi:hypothetical protein
LAGELSWVCFKVLETAWVLTGAVAASLGHYASLLALAAFGYVALKLICAVRPGYLVKAFYRVKSRIVFACSTRHDDFLRRAFQKKAPALLEARRRPQFGWHSHANAALTRTVIHDWIDDVVDHSGAQSYTISMSKGDQASTKKGQRLAYWDVDTRSEYRFDNLADNDIVLFKDSDYHEDDINSYLDGHNVLIATVCPIRPGGTVGGDISYRFVDDNFDMVVDGYANYHHRLWDYRKDTAYVLHWFGAVLYHIDTIRLDPLRVVVAATPITTIWGPVGWLAFRSNPIRRLKVHRDSFSVITETIGDSILHHVTDNGSPFAATISQQGLMSLLETERQSQYHKATASLTLFDTRNRLKEETHHLASGRKEIPGDEITLIHRYYFSWKKSNGLVAAPRGVVELHNYFPASAGVDEAPKPTMTAKIPSLFDKMSAALGPSRCYTQDLKTIEDRVLKVRNNTPTPGYHKKYMREFVDLLVTRRHTAEPWPLHAVLETQARPSQRATFEKVSGTVDMDIPSKPSAFMKVEASQHGKAARNITPMDASHRTRFAAYAKVVSELMQTQHWCAVGDHPRSIAERVHSKVKPSQWVVLSDFSKMDGSSGDLAHELLTTIYHAVFDPKYHNDIDFLLKETLNKNIITAEGVKYNSGKSTLSGCLNTTQRSTLPNAYLNYVTLRKMGHRPERAWARLGLYCGDDGLSPDSDAKLFTQVCAEVGYTVTNEVATSRVDCENPTRVNFLSRFFVDAWTGPESVCDPRRVLARAHLVNGPPSMSNKEYAGRMMNKAVGQLQMDADTPLVSDFMRAILRAVDSFGKAEWDFPDERPYYSNAETQWPQLKSWDNQHIVCELLGIDDSHLARLCAQLAEVRTFDDFDNVTQLHAPRIGSFPIVLAGDVWHDQPPADVTQQPPPTLTFENENQASRKCQARASQAQSPTPREAAPRGPCEFVAGRH